MQNILKAARGEMMRALEGELAALNFAKAIRIAKMAERIASAEGRSYFPQVQKEVLEETEFYCPPLHRAILGELTSGETIVQEKYNRLHHTHTEAEQVRQAAELARDNIYMTQDRLQAKEETLQKEREMLHREREMLRRLQDTLMLTAGEQELDIPQLPELTPLEEEDEDEE